MKKFPENVWRPYLLRKEFNCPNEYYVVLGFCLYSISRNLFTTPFIEGFNKFDYI